MKTAILAPLVLAAGAHANTIVRWYGCKGEYQQTETTGDGCTNIEGWKNSDLCGVWVPPPGSDRCEFYTEPCWSPFGSTYKCSVSSGRCNAGPWEGIESYRCYTS